MMRSSMHALARAAAITVLLGATGSAAQSYPERPVRIVVGFAPGGSSDIVARVAAQHLSPLLGQPVVVENKPGAGGLIASDFIAKAAPDGYALLLATAGHSTQAAIMKELPFDPIAGFAWISTLTRYPFLVVTGAQSPLKSLADLIARAKAAPGKITYASVGVGASQHMLAEWFGAETGIEMLHIPFKGGTAPSAELIAGRVDIMFETITASLPHVKTGKLRALAVTSPQPVSFLPDVPAAARTVPQFVFQSWLGLAAPAATPAAIVERLNRDMRRMLAEPEVQKRFATLGGVAAPVSPAEMRAQITSEITRWKQIVASRHIERQ
ncbi:MAG: tripartite tricarboxylate transporter substrate binding protein [Burkholderiales bacterium]|nr:tripartite tricarboxylate transporter substrate binding protein [Burkholderiales bacterium]